MTTTPPGYDDHEGEPQRDTRPGEGVQWGSATSWRLHAALVAGLTLAGVATWLEWTRAHAGHAVAWVYTFEGPLFAILGTYLWWRLLHADVPSVPREQRRQRPGAGAGSGAETEPDPELLAWQAYLDRLHRADPPGGPPPR